MRFTVDQPITAPLARVEQAFVDSRFYETLAQMPNVGEPDVLERTEQDGKIRLRVRFAFTGDLAAPARRVLDPAKLTWVVDSTADLSTHRTTFKMLPDHYGDRLECAGAYTLVPDGGGTTVQRMEGDLKVNYPIVGRLAERGIVLGLKQNVAEEARLLERWVVDNPA